MSRHNQQGRASHEARRWQRTNEAKDSHDVRVAKHAPHGEVAQSQTRVWQGDCFAFQNVKNINFQEYQRMTRSRAVHHFEDPQLDDERLLAKMEARLDQEDGADMKNKETFGDNFGKWSYEEALSANEWLNSALLKKRTSNESLNATLLKYCIVKDSASTAPGSRSHSDPPSSERSSPRSPELTMTANALCLSADASPFLPEANVHCLADTAPPPPPPPPPPEHRGLYNAPLDFGGAPVAETKGPFLMATAPCAPPVFPAPAPQSAALPLVPTAAPSYPFPSTARLLAKGLATSPPMLNNALRSRRQCMAPPQLSSPKSFANF